MTPPWPFSIASRKPSTHRHVRGRDDPSQSPLGTATLADLLRAVLHRLPPADVARAACVCHLWRVVASDRAVLEAAFRAPWGVRRVLGDPATRAFWRAASLAHSPARGHRPWHRTQVLRPEITCKLTAAGRDTWMPLHSATSV
ncbi:hypothetical protein ZWY2020_040578 [Hordeum vulgare]|nr:hypothetical protein ZWY2020_040578 [Hordeum vulgare]